jgi:hypothetical protein
MAHAAAEIAKSLAAPSYPMMQSRAVGRLGSRSSGSMVSLSAGMRGTLRSGLAPTRLDSDRADSVRVSRCDQTMQTAAPRLRTSETKWDKIQVMKLIDFGGCNLITT